jgi:hypothetical protein
LGLPLSDPHRLVETDQRRQVGVQSSPQHRLGDRLGVFSKKGDVQHRGEMVGEAVCRSHCNSGILNRQWPD